MLPELAESPAVRRTLPLPRVLHVSAVTPRHVFKGSFHIFIPLPINRLLPGSFILHLIRCQLQRAQLTNPPMGHKRVTGMCKIRIMILEFAPLLIKRSNCIHGSKCSSCPDWVWPAGLTSERVQPARVGELFSQNTSRRLFSPDTLPAVIPPR